MTTRPLLRWTAHGTREYLEIVALRREVLRRPLGMDFTSEQLAGEAGQLHLGAWEGARLVGCLALVVEGAAARMRQVAVSPDRQGSGIGRLLAAECEAEALRRGATLMSLHARQTAAAFYERLGYVAEGEAFTEVGIPHRAMKKPLRRG